MTTAPAIDISMDIRMVKMVFSSPRHRKPGSEASVPARERGNTVIAAISFAVSNAPHHLRKPLSRLHRAVIYVNFHIAYFWLMEGFAEGRRRQGLPVKKGHWNPAARPPQRQLTGRQCHHDIVRCHQYLRSLSKRHSFIIFVHSAIATLLVDEVRPFQNSKWQWQRSFFRKRNTETR